MLFMTKRDDVLVLQMRERIALIAKFLKGVSEQKFLKTQLLQSAVVRELEVIGEAARMISSSTKSKFPNLPWQQMTAMRNRLIHGYFNVDYSIVWEVAHYNLSQVDEELERDYAATAPPVHPWRKCPNGYYYVNSHVRRVRPAAKRPNGLVSVQEHCRRNPSGKDQLYPDEILLVSKEHEVRTKVAQLRAPQVANDFDATIATWVQYWNEIFSGKSAPLTPETVKALILSESSFRTDVTTRVSKGNLARGLTQITDETRKILGNEKGELKDHFLTLSAKDLDNPTIAVCAAVRWLYHKRDQASSYLGREASWHEAVAHYKSYLRRKKDWRTQKGMISFENALKELNQEKKGS